MKTKKSPWYLNAILFMMIFSLSNVFCAEDTEKMVINKEDFPLKPGLIMEYTSKSNLKQVDAATIRHEYTEGSEIGGIQFVKRDAIMSDGTKQASFFYKSEDGIIRVPTMTSNEKTLLIKLPLSIGTAWVHEDFEGSKIIKSDKRAEMIETVTTPLGDLKCIKIRQRKTGATDTDEDSFLWVSKEYGIVKIELNKRIENKSIIKTVITISKYEYNKDNIDKKEGK